MDVSLFRSSPIGLLTPISGIDRRFNTEYRYWAYQPDDLGEEPVLSSQTWHAVTAANRAIARLDQASSLIPDPKLLRRPTLLREAQSTSALEGTFAPLEQVINANVSDEAPTSQLVEIFNYIEAANYAFASVVDRRRVSLGVLEEAQRRLATNTESESNDTGRVRTKQVAVGSQNGLIEDARFVPMPPGLELEIRARTLLDWINKTDSKRDPIVAAALAHYQFETLHPFDDGNGRIGRMLVVLQFMVDGLLREPLLSVSPWFEARRTNYQDQLANVSATGDWDSWVRFFATGVEASATDTAQRVDRLLAVRNRYVEILQRGNAKGVIRDIVDQLIATPSVTVSFLAKQFGKSQQGITQAVNRLVAFGILSEPVGSYNRRYSASDVWAAILAPSGRVPSATDPISASKEA